MPKLTTATGHSEFLVYNEDGTVLDNTASIRDLTLDGFTYHASAIVEVAGIITLTAEWRMSNYPHVIATASVVDGKLVVTVLDAAFRDE